MARPKWKLTVRNGPEVEHASFDDLSEAVAALRQKAMDIRSAGPAQRVRSLRDFEPEDLVRARLQLTGRGSFLRKPTAGIDVRGDGTFVPFTGGVGREELDPTDHETPFELVRETLESEER
ncbi:MAG TPA: hypothetical protein VFJ57_11410 [Solirubrobacterales bacterium]|nr:hypothetical protein [Solirubrobacterales bacterium]